MKRLTLPLIAVGILAACGGADNGTAQPAGVAEAAGPTSVSEAPATPSSVPVASAPAVPTPLSDTAPSSAPAVPTPLSDTAPPSAPANVPEALKFAAPLVGGGDIELTTLAGRPVLLWFWAPW